MFAVHAAVEDDSKQLQHTSWYVTVGCTDATHLTPTPHGWIDLIQNVVLPPWSPPKCGVCCDSTLWFWYSPQLDG